MSENSKLLPEVLTKKSIDGDDGGVSGITPDAGSIALTFPKFIVVFNVILIHDSNSYTPDVTKS